MVSKTSSTFTVRLQNDLKDWLGEEALRRGVSVNGLVSDLLEVARLSASERKAEPVKKAPVVKSAVAAKSQGLLVPFAGDLARKPLQKKAKG